MKEYLNEKTRSSLKVTVKVIFFQEYQEIQQKLEKDIEVIKDLSEGRFVALSSI